MGLMAALEEVRWGGRGVSQPRSSAQAAARFSVPSAAVTPGAPCAPRHVTTPQVREKESNIDSLITPIEEMYALLLRYEVRAPARLLEPPNRLSSRRCHARAGAAALRVCVAAPTQLALETCDVGPRGNPCCLTGPRAQGGDGPRVRPALRLAQAAQADHRRVGQPGAAAGATACTPCCAPRFAPHTRQPASTGHPAGLNPAAGTRRRMRVDVSCPRPPLPRRQAGFKRDLIREVRAFVADAQAFRRDWDASGPMVAGLDPMEAMDRLRKFQQMFEVRPGRGHGLSLGMVRTSRGAAQVMRGSKQVGSKRAPVSTQPSRSDCLITAAPRPHGARRSGSASGPTTAAVRSCLACR